MKNFKFILLLICLLAFSSIKAGTPTLSEDFNNVIKAYLTLKNSLVTGNTPVAQADAARLLAAVSNVSNKDMNATQRKVWLNYEDKLVLDSRHISESNTIDHKREHFANLSSNLMVVLKALNVNKATLYKQYCPMKKSYWLSETSAIKNPYYGNAMLECGTTQETFAAVK